MSTLLYGMVRTAVPADEAEIRSTTDVVDHDAPSAEMDSAPDFGEFDSDPDTEGGLTSRQLASHVIPSVQSVNPALAEANSEHNAIIDRQVSSSGTAAAREAAGEWGHGTLHIQEGIEPTIRDGAAFGEEYFKAERDPIQTGMGAYMTPAAPGNVDENARVQATANRNAREAASPYSQFLKAVT